ncbi:hypothetical protein CVT24_011777 [Panaeolus cyanescens]|uniref:Uncharacterized protein n=1 Tax=Panaeolus cyanescens TaxID=181874 RepID=A0A409VHJ5_9AGAR|nr:hypothetical protein CVT24_011777 [Panaeolus cyanescens]
MPAPVVYVFAIIGTVAAGIAFKEFVFDPHIAPAIERWKAEYDANRRRRREEPLLAQEVSQNGSGSRLRDGKQVRRGPTTGRLFDNSGHSRSVSSSSAIIDHGKSPSFQSGDVELRNFAAPEVKEWRSEMSSSTGQDMRQRRNIVSGPSSLDESIQPLSGYEPLSPSRTHVILEPTDPSTPTTISEPPSPLRRPSGLTPLMSSSDEQGPENAPSPLRSSITYSDSLSNSGTNPFESDEDVAHIQRTPPASRSPLAQLPTPSNSPPTRLMSPSIMSQSQTIPSAHHGMGHHVPSLSQSYPQELDYEHGLELLSPPSSRSESPFSMAGMSPDMRSNASSRQGPSSTTLSPSPLAMNLGNESFDTLSPAVQPQVLQGTSIPSSAPSSNSSVRSNSPKQGTRSGTESTASSTYLSFVEDDNASLRSFPQPYAHLGNSHGFENSASTLQQSASVSPGPAVGPIQHSSSLDGLGLFSNTLFPVPPRQPITPAAPPATQTQYFLNEQLSVGAGNRDPSYFRPHSVASSTSMTSHSRFETASSAGFVTLSANSHSNVSSAANSRAGSSLGVLSAGSMSADERETLSDLDFMSDYAASDVGGEAHSESGWSFASESSDGVRGSPRVGLARAAGLPSPSNQYTRR